MRNIKDPKDEWKMMGKSDGPKKFYQQTGLTKGEKYSFRVYTVNKAGPSKPSEPTPYATARKRKFPPIIDRDYLYKDKIWTKTGKILKFENQPV